MAYENEIYAMAAQFAPQGTQQQALMALCRAAETELTARLRPGIAPEQYGDALICAAAWTALANLPAANAADIRGFTAGDVSVSLGGENTAAGKLRSQALAILAPYMKGDFAFVGVRG